MNKTEICVPIRNEEELQQAKDMLESNGENINKSIFYLDLDDNLNYLYFSNNERWGLSIKDYGDVEISLSELESVLRGESESKKQSSIDWLVSLLNKEGFAPVLTDEEIQKAKQMHREESINFHIEVMKSGLFHEGEEKWTEGYLPKIKDMAEKTYNETFNKY